MLLTIPIHNSIDRAEHDTGFNAFRIDKKKIVKATGINETNNVSLVT